MDIDRCRYDEPGADGAGEGVRRSLDTGQALTIFIQKCFFVETGLNILGNDKMSSFRSIVGVSSKHLQYDNVVAHFDVRFISSRRRLSSRLSMTI
jgi:hypothetical protein